MAGTVKIWWHDGTVVDASRNAPPVVNEPELGYETVAVSTTPTASGPAPKSAHIAVIETDVTVRYLVRPSGGAGAANAVDSKPLPDTGRAVGFIGVEPGASISFIEG